MSRSYARNFVEARRSGTYATHNVLRRRDDGLSVGEKEFQPGERIVFDEGYRLAHLPLVNAGHPAVISEVDGRDYRDGTYEKTRYALVMPISADAFLESDEAQALELAMKSSSFAPKIAWEICERRRLRLHATLQRRSGDRSRSSRCGGSRSAGSDRPDIRLSERDRFWAPGTPAVSIFRSTRRRSGAKTHSRWCKKASACRRRSSTSSDIIICANELDPLETRELAELIDQWRDRIVVTTTIPFLELYATNDDLALSARVHAKIGAKASRGNSARRYRASSRIIAAPSPRSSPSAYWCCPT